MQENHALVMTHANLHPRNIRVKWEDPIAHGRGEAFEYGAGSLGTQRLV